MLFSLLFLACTEDPAPRSPQAISLSSPPEAADAIASFIHHLDDERFFLETPPPTAAEVFTLTLWTDPALCGECYRLEGADRDWQITGGGLLGVQYGLADLLERWGYRFPHPFHTDRPARIPAYLQDTDRLGEIIAPEQSLRALHLHTLHPIEGLWSTWVEPPSSSLADTPSLETRFSATVDWLIKNRGSRLQWVALDDISRDPDTLAAWRERTAAINALAHARGITTGLGIQLFGSGNLQQAFDLLDETGDPLTWPARMDARLAQVTGVGFDAYDLSFGEFFGEDPETFLAALELTAAQLAAREPAAELSGVIHVGDSPEQRVVYEGRDQIYYFLVRYADASIIPRVHTVMYYNLFEDAGGAYHHEDFGEHRDFLLESLAAGERVQYFPESAYWVAFDNPVPLYLPLYLRSRWLDVAEIAAAGPPLAEHVLFSSGGEWGGWQTDALTLRMGHTRPPDWGAALVDWFSAWGPEGAALAEQVVRLGEAQHTALIEQRLAAYLAGRDAAMDVGFAAGVVAAPDRVTLTEAAALEAEGRAALRAAVVEPLSAYAEAVEAVLRAVEGCPLVSEVRWAAEIRDGVAVDLYRARFVVALYEAVLDGDASKLSAADAALSAGAAVVARRHRDLHDPLGALLVDADVDNPTIYNYGYLVRAEQLCFWTRERVEVARLLEGSTEAPPGCF